MAEEDIKMNAFTPVSDAAYIYAEAADGSQVKIKKENLINIIRGYVLRSYRSGLDSFIEDCNSLIDYNIDGIYTINGNTKNVPSSVNGYSILIKYSIGGYFYEEIIDFRNSKRWSRYFSSAWTAWREL